MLMLIFRLLFLTVLGLLAYDIALTWDFNKSHTYQFLRENGIIQNAKLLVENSQKFYSEAKLFRWAEENIPLYYNQTCFYLKPLLNLGKDLILVFLNGVISLFKHTEMYIYKNYPAFQNYVTVILVDILSLVENGALVLSKHIKNCAETLFHFVDNILTHT